MLNIFSDLAPGLSWFANPNRKSRFLAIKTNDIVDCKLMSHVNTRSSLPLLAILNINATPCALVTYTHRFSRPLTQTDVHVSPPPARLPRPDHNISSIIVCLSDCSVTYTRLMRAAHSTLSILKFISRQFSGVWRSCAQLTH